MKPALAVLLAALAVSDCGTMKGQEPGRGHGARRPANPNGSILAAEPPAQVPMPAPPVAGCLGAPR